jgi:hypothetical protein
MDVTLLRDRSDTTRLYHEIVTELVERSVTDFFLPVGGNRLHSGQILPSIWVGRMKLYQYQTLEDGVRQRYKPTYCQLFDPYRYLDSNSAATTIDMRFPGLVWYNGGEVEPWL